MNKITRLLLFFIFFSGIATVRAQEKATSWYLLAGTYNSEKSEGIYVYRFDVLSGEPAAVSMVKTDNPTFLAISPNGKYVYAVNENAPAGNKGSIAAFSFNRQEGKLRYLNKLPSGGEHPCHVAIDATGKWVTAANYAGGSLAVLSVGPGGALNSVVTVKQHTGKGTDSIRQEKPHVHSTMFSPDGNYLFSPDLGIDQVSIYRFNKKDGSLAAGPQSYFKTRNGAGPRHLALHPSGRFIYLAEEMAGDVVALRYTAGRLKELQTISAHPAGFKGLKGSSDLHVSPDGRFLYVSNRGDANSLAIFSIDQKSGLLTLAGFQSTLGKTPRNFTIDPTGRYLLVAHQDSDNIVIFKRNIATGLLTDTGKRISVGRPSCLKWVSMK